MAPKRRPASERNAYTDAASNLVLDVDLNGAEIFTEHIDAIVIILQGRALLWCGSVGGK